MPALETEASGDSPYEISRRFLDGSWFANDCAGIYRGPA
jgi:hypothetical protein